ncbi:MAG TPA: hypothetical protein VH880_09705 [Anaeromyxobacteraceae bacterium]
MTRASGVAALGLAAAACAPQFPPRSAIFDLRVLAIVASPLEVGPGESVTLRAVPVTPEGETVVSESWTFCPFSAGAPVAYACAIPACEVPLAPAADGSVTADPSALALQCLASLGGGAPPGGVPSELPAVVEVVFRYRAQGSAGEDREAVQLVPLHTGGPPAQRNQPPRIAEVAVGGEPLPLSGGTAAAPLRPGGGVEVRVWTDPGEGYVDALGRPLQESIVVSFYATAGRFDAARASGPEGAATLQHEEVPPGAARALVWVVARDLRGGAAVAGPFAVPIAP